MRSGVDRSVKVVDNLGAPTTVTYVVPAAEGVSRVPLCDDTPSTRTTMLTTSEPVVFAPKTWTSRCAVHVANQRRESDG